MRNRLNLMISGAALLVMGICVGIFYGSRPEPVKPPAIEQPDLSPVELPEVKVETER